MAWETVDRTKTVLDPEAAPVLSEAVREKIRSFFDRYETKQAALLPAFHLVQEALGHVSLAAMNEIAEVLEIPPAVVLDTVGFYTHYWTHPKGEKVIVCCRSISCETMAGGSVLQAFKDALGIAEHQTTPDGKYSLMTEECLAGCDHAACVLINEKLHKRVKPEDVPALLADPNNDKIDVPRSDLYDAPPPVEPASSPEGSGEAQHGDDG